MNYLVTYIFREYFSVDAVAGAYDHRLISINANETIHFMKADDVSGQDGFFKVNDCTDNRIDIFLGSHDGKGYNFTIELYHDDSIKEEPQESYNTGVGRAASKGDSVVYTLCIPFRIIFFARILH